MYGRIVSRLTERVFDKSVWEASSGEGAEPKDALRAVLLIILFVLTFGAGMVRFSSENWIATFLKGEWARSHLLSFVSCIGGGVFLGACLLDLLPDSIESFEKTKVATEFPVPLAFVAVGFLLVLSIDQIVKAARERNVFGQVGYHIHSHDHEMRHEDVDSGEQDVAQSSIGVTMLVLALSVHALFEGLSLAVTSDASQLLQIFGALILHKCIMGFCLGVRLVQANLTTPWIALAQFLFSVQVLIGGLAGIGIMKFISGGEQSLAAIVSSILQAIACGTFLYITTFEVIPHELHNGKFRILKTLFIYFGFGIVVAFILIFPEAS
ncbi:Protein CBG19738 [Caenorhabditis briggsae]|uniref:Protein CBG19738 n=1 Tax=Caenorhabditis briggsae TaxID=6238 RepID=A8XWF6_CAEBR|nr:Protein CBG19738 [Caenorhabditis briggsae]CAP36975.2 Protein CBG19738 [Caenorhabditis briggsae]